MPGEWKPKAADADRASKVRDELRNVLASEAFKGGKRAQDFLQLVVEHTLAGRLDSLRERMLGAEMFGRPVDYDTANDAVVRVKASEVRRRLAQYYGGLEAPPPVRIDLPPGSYVPQFSFDASLEAASGPSVRCPVVDAGGSAASPAFPVRDVAPVRCLDRTCTGCSGRRDRHFYLEAARLREARFARSRSCPWQTILEILSRTTLPMA